MKQKKSCFLKLEFQNGRLKKLGFSKSPILKKNLRKFHGLVLGLVELIDVAQPISLRDSPAKAQKQAKNAFFVFLRLRQKASRPYKLSYIASINPTV
jgi:hypothetical protein